MYRTGQNSRQWQDGVIVQYDQTSDEPYIIFYSSDEQWERMDLPDATVVYRGGCASEVCVPVSAHMIPRRSVFDLSLSGRPGASKAVREGEKTKTRKQDGGPGARPQNSDRPSARGV